MGLRINYSVTLFDSVFSCIFLLSSANGNNVLTECTAINIFSVSFVVAFRAIKNSFEPKMICNPRVDKFEEKYFAIRLLNRHRTLATSKIEN